MRDERHLLVEKWQECQLTLPPYIFPGDSFLLEDRWKDRIYDFASLETFANSEYFGLEGDSRFHAGLIPIPFMGNLDQAKIFLLMLNPGFHPGDYFAEYEVEYFRQAITNNLRQENSDSKYPFLFLNPQFAWHPGFGYWYRKLYRIVKLIEKHNNVPHLSALSILANQIVTLELVPYHSSVFSGKGFQKLESAKLMLDYAKNLLIPEAQKGNITIIATRSANAWNLPDHRNIVIYGAAEARAAYLTPQSNGGKSILRQLGIPTE